MWYSNHKNVLKFLEHSLSLSVSLFLGSSTVNIIKALRDRAFAPMFGVVWSNATNVDSLRIGISQNLYRSVGINIDNFKWTQGWLRKFRNCLFFSNYEH